MRTDQKRTGMRELLESFDDGQTTIGGMIRIFRKGRGFTLKTVSELTGIAETHLSSIENDKLDLGMKRAGLLAAALGVNPQEILFPNGKWEKKEIHLEIEEKSKKIAV